MLGTMEIDDITALDSAFNEANLGLGGNFKAGFGIGFDGNTIVITRNGTRATATSTFASGVPTTLLMKFDQVTGDTSLWVNPDLSLPEAANVAEATRTLTEVDSVQGQDYDGIVFRGGDFAGSSATTDFTDFSVYYNGDSPFGTVAEPVTPQIVAFSYDPSTGEGELSLAGTAETAYAISRANDLDFESPDENPLHLTSSSVGSLDGNEVTTDEEGNATVRFSLGTETTASFLRAEEAP